MARGRSDGEVAAASPRCRPRRRRPGDGRPSAPQTDRTAKRNLTGVFQHWDCLDPDWNPGGIWRPVGISETGPVRLNRLRVLCAEATSERARLDITADLDAAEPGSVELRTTV